MYNENCTCGEHGVFNICENENKCQRCGFHVAERQRRMGLIRRGQLRKLKNGLTGLNVSIGDEQMQDYLSRLAKYEAAKKDLSPTLTAQEREDAIKALADKFRI